MIRNVYCAYGDAPRGDSFSRRFLTLSQSVPKDGVPGIARFVQKPAPFLQDSRRQESARGSSMLTLHTRAPSTPGTITFWRHSLVTTIRHRPVPGGIVRIAIRHPSRKGPGSSVPSASLSQPWRISLPTWLLAIPSMVSSSQRELVSDRFFGSFTEMSVSLSWIPAIPLWAASPVGNAQMYGSCFTLRGGLDRRPCDAEVGRALRFTLPSGV